MTIVICNTCRFALVDRPRSVTRRRVAELRSIGAAATWDSGPFRRRQHDCTFQAVTGHAAPVVAGVRSVARASSRDVVHTSPAKLRFARWIRVSHTAIATTFVVFLVWAAHVFAVRQRIDWVVERVEREPSFVNVVFEICSTFF